MAFATPHRWDIPVIGLMIVMGLASIGFGLWQRRRRVKAAGTSARWPFTDATILAVEVVHERNSDSPDDYVPLVRYRYAVGLKQYESDRLRAGGRTTFRQEASARAAIASYRAGNRVPVRYDPERPERSVLEVVPATSDLRGWVVVGLFMLGSAAYAAVTITFPDGFG